MFVKPSTLPRNIATVDKPHKEQVIAALIWNKTLFSGKGKVQKLEFA